MKKHLMLDIETMGNQSYSAIVSIAAVYFDIMTGETYDEFYRCIDLKSCIDKGLIINADTLVWWFGQNENAIKEITRSDKYSLGEALDDFSAFCTKDCEIWARSARFDCGILQNAYNKLDMPIPWDFRKERCVRTLVSFNEKLKDSVLRNGDDHNALHDCKNQIKYTVECYKSITE